jgi:C-terminal processing protease CtpA/Prc
MSAALPGVVRLGDVVLEVNGTPVSSATHNMSLEEIKDLITGPRASRVSVKFQRFDNDCAVDQNGQLCILRSEVAEGSEVKTLIFVDTFKRGVWDLGS